MSGHRLLCFAVLLPKLGNCFTCSFFFRFRRETGEKTKQRNKRVEKNQSIVGLLTLRLEFCRHLEHVKVAIVELL